MNISTSESLSVYQKHIFSIPVTSEGTIDYSSSSLIQHISRDRSNILRHKLLHIQKTWLPITSFFVTFLLFCTKLPFDIYCKDWLSMSPSELLLISAAKEVPWALKVVGGLIIDVYPILNSKRSIYMVLAVSIYSSSWLMFSLQTEQYLKSHFYFVLFVAMLQSAGLALLDVVNDSLIVATTQSPLKHKIQSKCFYYRAAGVLIGQLIPVLFMKDKMGQNGVLNPLNIFRLGSLLSLYEIFVAIKITESDITKDAYKKFSNKNTNKLHKNNKLSNNNNNINNINDDSSRIDYKQNNINNNLISCKEDNNIVHNSVGNGNDYINNTENKPHNNSSTIHYKESNNNTVVNKENSLINNKTNKKEETDIINHSDNNSLLNNTEPTNYANNNYSIDYTDDDKKSFNLVRRKQSLTTHQTIQKLITVISTPRILKLIIFIFAICAAPSASMGMFYYISTPIKQNGLGFSVKFMSFLYVAGGAAHLSGNFIYNKYLMKYSVNKVYKILLSVYLILYISQLVLVYRINRLMRLPDTLFVFSEDVFQDALSAMLSVPLQLIIARECPKGIEGTLYAAIVSIANIAGIVSRVLSSLFMETFNIIRDEKTGIINFDHLGSLIIVVVMFKFIGLYMTKYLPKN